VLDRRSCCFWRFSFRSRRLFYLLGQATILFLPGFSFASAGLHECYYFPYRVSVEISYVRFCIVAIFETPSSDPEFATHFRWSQIEMFDCEHVMINLSGFHAQQWYPVSILDFAVLFTSIFHLSSSLLGGDDLVAGTCQLSEI